MAKTINQLSSALASKLTDEFEIFDTTLAVGQRSKKVTNSQIITLFNSNAQLGSSAQVTGLDSTLAAKQPLSTELTGISSLNSVGVVKRTGSGTYTAANIGISDVTNLSTSLAAKLDLAGGTMTGALIASGDPTNPLGVVTKQYADGLVVGLLDDRGSYDASSNVWPSTGGSGTAGAILKGDLWTISVAGTLGGASVYVGAWIRALVDTPGQTTANWDVVNANIGYVAENVVNKSTNTNLGTSDTLYPSQKAVKTYVDNVAATKQPLNTTLTNLSGITGTFGGSLSFANAFTTSGNFALTLTTTAATNATLPSGTTTLVPTTGSGATGTWGISISGTASTCTTVPVLSGDITTTGSTNVTTLKNTGTAGTYTKVTTDAQGRVSSGTTLSASDIPTLTASKISDFDSAAATAALLPASSTVTTSAVDVTLTNPLKGFYAYNFTASGKKLILPVANVASNYTNGKFFVIYGSTGTNDFNVYYQDGTTGVQTVKANIGYLCWFYDTSTANGTIVMLPLGSLGGDNRNNVSITGGLINNTTVGASTAATLRGTELKITNATSGYVETALNYYEEYSFSFNWSGAFTLNTQTISVTRINNMVYLKLSETLQTATSGAILSTSANLPSRFIPNNNTVLPIIITNSGSAASGRLFIGGNSGGTPGQIQIGATVGGGTFTGSGTAGFAQTAGFYYL